MTGCVQIAKGVYKVLFLFLILFCGYQGDWNNSHKREESERERTRETVRVRETDIERERWIDREIGRWIDEWTDRKAGKETECAC